MSNYSATVAAIIKNTKAREASFPLMNEAHSRFLLQPSRSAKVCLFFHGFTATPQQFLPVAQAFSELGYNVVIPLLPGHGIAGDWDSDNPPPLPEDPQIYQEFGLYWLKQVQTLGEEVVIGGLSGGSTLAAWLALECPTQIYRTLLFAPFLSNSNGIVDLLVKILNIYFEWKTEPGKISFGYQGFLMPALRVFLDMGQNILEQAKNSITAAPMFIISSESDRAVDENENKELFTSVVKLQPKTWYHCFDRVFDIPHNMMTKVEGNDYQNLVFAIAKAYVESNLSWTELNNIIYQMLQGETFNSVVARNNLTQSISPELLNLITISNKKAIISEYNSD